MEEFKNRFAKVKPGRVYVASGAHTTTTPPKASSSDRKTSLFAQALYNNRHSNDRRGSLGGMPSSSQSPPSPPAGQPPKVSTNGRRGSRMFAAFAPTRPRASSLSESHASGDDDGPSDGVAAMFDEYTYLSRHGGDLTRRKRSPWVLHPHGRHRTVWDVFSSLVICCRRTHVGY